nr:sugar phosphate isomerase/epimerase [Cnuibacter physcomitrellae]
MSASPPLTREVDVPSGAPARIRTPSVGDPRLARLSLNQRTTAEWSLREALDGAVAAGLPAIGLWREPVQEVGLGAAVELVRDSGLRVSSLCRGGFFTAEDEDQRRRAHDENLRALDEAAALGAPTLVLVPGGLPTLSRDLVGARTRAAEAVARLAPEARARGVVLGIEPMNPLYAADRGVVSTLAQALRIARDFAPDEVGVVVDTFHLWWEPDVLETVRSAGDRIVSYQVCDWITPLPADTLLARGMMGDGHVDFAAFTAAVADAGYQGDVEVEIFHAEVWAAPGADTVATLARRYVELVEPWLGT